jgi:hypothetical protein
LSIDKSIINITRTHTTTGNNFSSSMMRFLITILVSVVVSLSLAYYLDERTTVSLLQPHIDAVVVGSRGLFHFQSSVFPHQRVITTTATQPSFVIVLPDPKLDRVIPHSIVHRGLWEPHLTTLFHSVLEGRCEVEQATTTSHDATAGANTANAAERRSRTRRALTLDIGANSGYYGLYFAALGCRVIAVEPQLRLTRLVRQSVVLNDFEDRFDVVQAIASDNVVYERKEQQFVGLGNEVSKRENEMQLIITLP